MSTGESFQGEIRPQICVFLETLARSNPQEPQLHPVWKCQSPRDRNFLSTVSVLTEFGNCSPEQKWLQTFYCFSLNQVF